MDDGVLDKFRKDLIKDVAENPEKMERILGPFAEGEGIVEGSLGYLQEAIDDFNSVEWCFLDPEKVADSAKILVMLQTEKLIDQYNIELKDAGMIMEMFEMGFVEGGR